MKDKKVYIILVISILIAILGISYAYFTLNIIGNDTAKTNKVTSGTLELTFTDTTEVSLENIIPGESVTKTIKVTNTGTLDTSYNIGWTDYTNEIINNELVIEGTCKRLNSSNVEEGTCNSISQKAITGSNIVSNISIEPNITHEYTLKITFIDTGENQNYNNNKSFNAKLNITESTAKTVYCTFDGELVQGAEYVNGQYTYKYMQEFNYDENGELNWTNISNDGWGVQLTDKDSTNPVTSKVCTYINNKPVVSMSHMFTDSQATSIDLSTLNTSNVTNMLWMFQSTQVTALDLSSFDTSNVTNMACMFCSSKLTTIDLSNFDTSKVTNMAGMFSSSIITSLNLSNFDTSNVTDMSSMFNYSKVTTLDLSGFNTSKVTDMSSMFSSSQATVINLSNFDTSEVISMNSMFYQIKTTTLDLSSFDTSKVINMTGMFYNATNLQTIYVSNKYITTNVKYGNNMFTNCPSLVGEQGTTFDSSKISATYAHIDGGTTNPGYFTSK